jgi:Kef-type K+ transport system membrane component KefB
VGVGLLVSPPGMVWFDININSELIKVIAELTLILALCIDGSELNLSKLRHQGGVSRDRGDC